MLDLYGEKTYSWISNYLQKIMVKNLENIEWNEELLAAPLSPKELEWQTKLLKSLGKLEKLGFNEKKYIDQVQQAKNADELHVLEEKFKEAGLKFYRQELLKSGVYTPLMPAESTFMDWEFGALILDFETSNLDTMIDKIGEIEAIIKTRKPFREVLQRQSLVIQKIYCDRVAPKKHGENLLKEILEEYSMILKKPLSVQTEFLNNRISDEDTLKNLDTKYQQLRGAYVKNIQENLGYFGGNKISSPLGKIPAAAWEFIVWFEGRPNFKEMERALKELPKQIEVRKNLIEEAENHIQYLSPEDQKRIRRRVHGMRRHELEEFLEELEEMATNESQYVKEAHHLTRSKYRGFPLFQSTEIRFKLNSIRKRNPEQQKVMLESLKFELEDRQESIKKFLEFPPILQKKHQEKFQKGNESDRSYLLQSIQNELQAKKSLEALVSEESLVEAKEKIQTENELESIKKALLKKEVLEEQFKKMQEENAFYRLKTQEDAQKILDKNIQSEQVEYGQNIQTENYVNSYKNWMKMREGLHKKEDATSERELRQVEKIEKVRAGYEKGTLVDSYVARQRVDLTLEALKNGQSSVEKEIARARYKTDIYIESEQSNGDARVDLEKIQAKELQHLAQEFLNKLIEQKGGDLSLTTKENLKNSTQLIESIKKYIDDNV